MSYILDALKKADAERARDAAAVPDLYAQGDAADEGARASSHGLMWLLLALLAVLLAGLVWVGFGATTAEPIRSAEPVLSPVPLSVPQPQLPAALPQTTAAAVTAPARAVTAPTPSNPPPRKPTLSASAASPAPLATLAELPAGLRAQLPALAVGGSVYSAAAASRIVILNGQVFREGDQPVDGLLVEQIGLKSTVLSFRGQRFELKH